MKQFTFTSIENIQQNFELFDDEYKEIKNRKKKEEEDEVFRGLEGLGEVQNVWGDDFLENFGGAKASGTEAARDELPGDLNKYLSQLTLRFDEL